MRSYLGPTWFALLALLVYAVSARAASDYSVAVLMLLVCIVWAVDRMTWRR